MPLGRLILKQIVSCLAADRRARAHEDCRRPWQWIFRPQRRLSPCQNPRSELRTVSKIIAFLWIVSARTLGQPAVQPKWRDPAEKSKTLGHLEHLKGVSVVESSYVSKLGERRLIYVASVSRWDLMLSWSFESADMDKFYFAKNLCQLGLDDPSWLPNRGLRHTDARYKLLLKLILWEWSHFPKHSPRLALCFFMAARARFPAV